MSSEVKDFDRKVQALAEMLVFVPQMDWIKIPTPKHRNKLHADCTGVYQRIKPKPKRRK